MRISDWSSDVCSSDLGYRPDGSRAMPAHREGRRAVNASFQSGKPGSVLSTPRAFGSIGTTEGLRSIRECRAKAALPQSLCRLGVTTCPTTASHFRSDQSHEPDLRELRPLNVG